MSDDMHEVEISRAFLLIKDNKVIAIRFETVMGNIVLPFQNCRGDEK